MGGSLWLNVDADFLQAKNVTIALAVSSIYAVDFSINVGKRISEFFFMTGALLTVNSTSMLSQSYCGYITDTVATGRICLGCVFIFSSSRVQC